MSKKHVVTFGGGQAHGKKVFWSSKLGLDKEHTCVECDNKKATLWIIIGVIVHHVCSSCYTVVMNRPRGFNRAGRRAFNKLVRSKRWMQNA